MFVLLSMVQTLGGVSSLLIAGSVALGGAVTITILRRPMQKRLKPRRRPLSSPSRIRPDGMGDPSPLPQPEERITRWPEPAAAERQDYRVARDAAVSSQLGTLCPPELSRRIDELELKVKARGAGR